MIQRIQTLYLLGAIGLVICSFFLPVAELIGQDGTVYSLILQRMDTKNMGDLGGIAFRIAQIVSVILVVSLLITLFFYAKRLVQLTLCIYNIALLVILNGLFLFSLIYAKTSLNYIVSYKVIAIFPIIGAVLVYLANRSIKKDEDLVRSLDRIR